MRYSKLLIPTTREVPAEAEIPSHRLMIRAGFFRKLASGTYAYLPAGWRSLRKIMQIVREEMDAAGAQELDLPFIQPMELWEKTGRRSDYGQTLGWFVDRHGRENVLAPTAEEVVTAVAAAEINSYKQLPINLYQIKLKYRDEFRPRFGALRSREFVMKDAYSFHAGPDCLHAEYRRMYDAYRRIFDRCGVPYVIVEAETGEMGGSGSHQFTVPCENGEDMIVFTRDDSYAANLEKAGVDAVQPPADLEAKRQAVPPMENVHTPGVGSIEAVCDFMETQPAEMIKTLVYKKTDGRVLVALVRGDHELNPEKLTGLIGSAELADQATIESLTGAAVGFAGPQGLLEKLLRGAGPVSSRGVSAPSAPDDAPHRQDAAATDGQDAQATGVLLIDPSVAAMVEGSTGANETDHHVRHVVPGRDFPLQGEGVVVADLRNAVEGDTRDGKPLQFKRGIEVGQVFKLGTKYSQTLDATFLDEDGQTHPCLMGCYGIGINRILASAIEAGHDENGCILPANIAPWEVLVIPLNNDQDDVRQAADTIYRELLAAGADALLDDRDERAGVKFKDADLLGVPLRVVIGGRGLANGVAEVKRRTDEKPTDVPLGEVHETVMTILMELREPRTSRQE
jgi:prolyl-tRNA synthetase